jgi:GNAT superfamily N-acetyltransferase
MHRAPAATTTQQQQAATSIMIMPPVMPPAFSVPRAALSGLTFGSAKWTGFVGISPLGLCCALCSGPRPGGYHAADHGRLGGPSSIVDHFWRRHLITVEPRDAVAFAAIAGSWCAPPAAGSWGWPACGPYVDEAARRAWCGRALSAAALAEAEPPPLQPLRGSQLQLQLQLQQQPTTAPVPAAVAASDRPSTVRETARRTAGGRLVPEAGAARVEALRGPRRPPQNPASPRRTPRTAAADAVAAPRGVGRAEKKRPREGAAPGGPREGAGAARRKPGPGGPRPAEQDVGGGNGTGDGGSDEFLFRAYV